MNNNVSLTIGIPTYNGAKYLRETIDSVLSQLPENRDRKIEILISNNASTDETKEIFASYQKANPDIFTYSENEQNIGYDRNVDCLFKRANGAYVWLLGDDDRLAPHALNKFFVAFDSHQDAAVFLFSLAFVNIETGERTWKPAFNEDFLCGSGSDFFKRTMWGTAALSSLCIKKDLWNEQNLASYWNSHWIHVGAVIKILSGDRKAYVFADEMAVVRTHNPRWQGNFGNQLETGLKHLLIFRNTLELGYDPSIYRSFLENRYKRNLLDVLVMKPREIKRQWACAKLMGSVFYSFPLFWLLHLPVLFVPNMVVRSLMAPVRQVRRLLSRSAVKA